MSMKNSNDTIGNQTRDIPTCSAVYASVGDDARTRGSAGG
jgi:hypothetical protein